MTRVTNHGIPYYGKLSQSLGVGVEGHHLQRTGILVLVLVLHPEPRTAAGAPLPSQLVLYNFFFLAEGLPPLAPRMHNPNIPITFSGVVDFAVPIIRMGAARWRARRLGAGTHSATRTRSTEKGNSRGPELNRTTNTESGRKKRTSSSAGRGRSGK